MKKLIVLMLGIMIVCGSTARANNGWGLFASYWDPKDGSSAVGPGIKLSIEMVSAIQMGVRVSYFDDIGKDQNGADVQLQAIPIEMDLVLNMPVMETGKVYGGLGLGYYMLDADIKLDNGSKPDADPGDKVGYYFILGAEFEVQEFAAVFAEAKYTVVKADDITVDADGLNNGKLDGLGANLGLMITW